MMIDYGAWALCEETPVAMFKINGEQQAGGWCRAIAIPTEIAQNAVWHSNEKYDKLSATIIQYMDMTGRSVAWLSQSMLLTRAVGIKETASFMNRTTRKNFFSELKKRGIWEWSK